jgi:8-oxo-dGTP pyrophosphatase MutT (NUDIX family)
VIALPQPVPTPGRRLPAVEERSAGGIAVRICEGLAFVPIIARRNRAGRVEWCLPKGHVEPGETLVETAVREVAEETGIDARVLIELGTIDYWFATATKRVHKFVHHYLLEAIGGELTVENDPDREAIDAAWTRLDEVHRRLTFPNERRIAQAAWRRLAGDA